MTPDGAKEIPDPRWGAEPLLERRRARMVASGVNVFIERALESNGQRVVNVVVEIPVDHVGDRDR
jgi:hypothetical protein